MFELKELLVGVKGRRWLKFNTDVSLARVASKTTKNHIQQQPSNPLNPKPRPLQPTYLGIKTTYDPVYVSTIIGNLNSKRTTVQKMTEMEPKFSTTSKKKTW